MRPGTRVWAGKALLVHERAPSGSFLAALSAHFLFRKVGSTLVPVRLGFQEDAVGSPTQARVRRGLLTPTNAPPPTKRSTAGGVGRAGCKEHRLSHLLSRGPSWHLFHHLPLSQVGRPRQVPRYASSLFGADAPPCTGRAGGGGVRQHPGPPPSRGPSRA